MAAVVPLLALAVGCGGEAESDDERVHFTPLERDEQSTREIDAPEPPVSLEEREELARLVRKFRQRAPEFFAKKTKDRPVSETERLFLSSGKYLQLVPIYQQVVDEQGLESPAAPRLAWVLVRLGQEKQARQLLDELLGVRPDDPFVHFVDGAYWFNQSTESSRAAAKAVLSWRRVLELDSTFEGPRRLDSRALKQKIQQIERRLPEAPEALASQEGPVDRGGPPPEERAAPENPEGAEMGDTGVESGGADRADAGRGADAGTASGPDAGSTARARSADAGVDGGARTPTPVLVTRAELATNDGELDRARRLYRRILEERGSDRPDAKFGLIQLGYRQNPNDESLAKRLRDLVDHPDMTASLAYEMGLFAQSKLERSKLAETCWKRVRQLDPSYAEQVGIGAN